MRRVNVVPALCAPTATSPASPVALAVRGLRATRGRALLLSSSRAQKVSAHRSTTVAAIALQGPPPSAVATETIATVTIATVTVRRVWPVRVHRRDVDGWYVYRRHVRRDIRLWRNVSGRVSPAPLPSRARAVPAPVSGALKLATHTTLVLVVADTFLPGRDLFQGRLAILLVQDRKDLSSVLALVVRAFLDLASPQQGGGGNTHLGGLKGPQLRVRGLVLRNGSEHQTEQASRHEQNRQKEGSPLRANTYHLCNGLVQRKDRQVKGSKERLPFPSFPLLLYYNRTH